MDSKGEESQISYPNIFFMIDSFEEVGTAPVGSWSELPSLGPHPCARSWGWGGWGWGPVWTPARVAPTLMLSAWQGSPQLGSWFPHL